jgi:glycosyltransferase involved in cell wall biosynthesis
MTIMSETRVVSRKSFVLEGHASQARGGSLFLSSRSDEPCGVETFTRKLVAALKTSTPDGGYELVCVSRRWRDLPSVFRRVVQADRIVFSVPLVAWKQVLIIPLLLLLFAFAIRRPISVFLHEWSAMHWLRRLFLIPFVALSESILVLSPYIRDQIASDRWIAGAAKKCRLIPHPPIIHRPDQVKLTDNVRRVEQAAEDCDIVIGYFGAIYRGKSPTALLEICDHLRNRGIRALIVFIGSFTKSLDEYEGQFRARMRDMALEKQVIITGYIESEEELFALFERIGAFLFHFPEGLTARRSSVIACLQSNRPVIVSAPQSRNEFLHHEGLTTLIESGALSFVSRSASADEIADQLLAAAGRSPGTNPAIDFDAWWAATTTAARAVL